MRLIKIVIDAFQCIERAEIDLSPGLNILYGPNDHGKSTLASAIRAGLLLPHSSTTREQHVSWHTGDPPQVTLSFSTEEQRYWRVRKVFAKTGSSTLDLSKDGTSYSKDCEGRQVDDKLRDLLGWGIPKPGGTGASKGLPESFLTTVLLAAQADVPAILERGLEGDKEESGRARLNLALQALAQDPTFKKVLDKAKLNSARAFTNSGKWSQSRSSPLVEITEHIQKLKEDQASLDRKIKESDAAEQILSRLQEECTQLELRLYEQQEQLAKVQDDFTKSLSQAKLQEELDRALQHLEKIQQELNGVAQEALTQKDREKRLEEMRSERAELLTQEADAVLALQLARKHLEAATSEQGAQQAELRRQQLENERLLAEKDLTNLRAGLKQALEAQALADEATQSGAVLKQLQEQVQELETNESTLRQKLEATTAEEARLRQLREFGALLESRSQLEEAEHSTKQADLLRESAAGDRQEADGIENAIMALALPSFQEVKVLEKLARELEKAEDRLGGGLSITLQPLRELDIQISSDGQPSQSQSGQAKIHREAQRSLQITVADLFEATITAGEASARQAVEELRQRWADAGQPVLARSGHSDIAELVEALQLADSRLAEAKQLRVKAANLEQASAEHQARAERLVELRERVSQREQRLADQDETELTKALASLGSNWESELTRQTSESEKSKLSISGELQQTQQDLSGLLGRLDSDRASHLKTMERAANAMAPYPDGTTSVLNGAPSQIAALEKSVAHLGEQLSSLLNHASTEVAAAEKAIGVATKAQETLAEQRSKLDEAVEQLGQQVAGGAATLELRQRQIQALDRAAAATRVAELEAEIARNPAITATGEEVEKATQSVKTVQQLIQDKEREINQARGRLSNVGGNVVRDEKNDLDKALDRALEKEHQIQVDFSAWKLLAETLREVENTHGSHLGKALSGPISTRLAELSSGRYSQLEIDPHLKGQGLSAAGANRPFESLSEGTKDQIATLFRLGIAEHLGSTIILDDHLNQSDPDKIQWFLSHLIETSKKIQVILITCRPKDYLVDEYWPSSEQIYLDSTAANLRAVNLGQAVRRYPNCTNL